MTIGRCYLLYATQMLYKQNLQRQNTQLQYIHVNAADAGRCSAGLPSLQLPFSVCRPCRFATTLFALQYADKNDKTDSVIHKDADADLCCIPTINSDGFSHTDAQTYMKAPLVLFTICKCKRENSRGRNVPPLW